MNTSLHGVLVPTVTPFTKKYEIDEATLIPPLASSKEEKQAALQKCISNPC